MITASSFSYPDNTLANPDEEFIVTGSHMTSRNQGSVSRQEKEPWERGC